VLDSKWSQSCAKGFKMEIINKAVALLVSGWIGCVVAGSWCLAEVSTDPGEVAGTWVTARNGGIPNQSFKAGIANGRDLFVCRGYYNSGLYNGRISPADKKCFIFYGDVEVGLDEYEVLQEDAFLQWESTGLGLPANL